MNSVICVVKKQCDDKGIPFRIEVEPFSYSEITDVEKTGLLHNLLDNALEANERLEGKKKGIFLSVGKTADEIRIEVRNAVQPGAAVTLETNKENKENHGIGTEIIDSIVSKYSGRKELETDCRTGVFRKKIYLEINRTSSE